MIAGIPGSLPWFLVSTMVWTWGEIILAVNAGVFVASQTPVNHRARFNGILQMLRGAGRSFSPVASGYLLAALGYRGIWLFIGALGLLLTAGLAGIGEWDRRLTAAETALETTS